MGEARSPEPYNNHSPATGYHSNADTSRPFRSVKEAVAIFGDRIVLRPNICSPKPFSFPMKSDTSTFSSPSPKLDDKSSWKYSLSTPNHRDLSYNQDTTLTDTVKRLEADLKETKAELKLLKERENKTEVALASLNAELHKNMSKLAWAEAVKAAACSRSASTRGEEMDGKSIRREDDKKILFGRMVSSPSPSSFSKFGQDEENLSMASKMDMKVMKRKPIIPLVKDLLSWKKRSSTSLDDNPLYASSPIKWI